VARRSIIGVARTRFESHTVVGNTINGVDSDSEVDNDISRVGRFGWLTEVKGPVLLNRSILEVTR
jgi:hypothetical protein